MAAMPDPSWRPNSLETAAGTWKSSADRTPPKASSCCHDDGWSSAPSRFSAAAAVSPRTSKPASLAPNHGYLSQLSPPSSAGRRLVSKSHPNYETAAAAEKREGALDHPS